MKKDNVLVISIASILIGLMVYVLFRTVSAPVPVVQPVVTEQTIQPKSETKTDAVSSSVSLDMSSDIAKEYKTAFTAALQRPANFDGHYAIASWGCGTACISYGVVDKLNGKAYEGPTDDMGSFSGTSDFEAAAHSVNSNVFKAIGYKSINVYTFANGVFTLSGTEPFPTK